MWLTDAIWNPLIFPILLHGECAYHMFSTCDMHCDQGFLPFAALYVFHLLNTTVTLACWPAADGGSQQLLL